MSNSYGAKRVRGRRNRLSYLFRFGVCGIALWLGLAQADTTVLVGALSYDTFIPAGGGSAGVDAFNLANLTGGFSLPPDFPVGGDLTFGSATLTLTLSDLSQDIFTLGDIGPGFLLDLNGNPIVQVAGDEVFDSAEFRATLSPLTFRLSDGSTFTADSSLIDAFLLPSAGFALTVDVDQTTISLSGGTQSSTPEPPAGILALVPVLLGLAWKIRRRRGSAGLAVLSVLLSFGAQEARTQTAVAVTLTPSTSPAAGEPGVTSIIVTGSNFPAGTILPASITITLKPGSGSSVVTTSATAVTTVTGTTRRVTFTIPATVSVAAPATYAVTLAGATSTGTPFASSNAASLTVNPAGSLLSIAPTSGVPGQTLSVTITGQFTNFVQGATVGSFGQGIAVSSLSIVSATQAMANIVIAASASTGVRTVTMTTGLEVASLPAGTGFTVAAAGGPPSIGDFNPKSAPAGTVITVTGANLQPAAGTSAQFTLAKQGGGTMTGFASSTSTTSLTFIVPAGAASGVPSVTVNGQTANAATTLTIVPASTFSVSVAPGTASVIQGQSAGVSVSLTSASGFNSLAALSVSGAPSGVTAAFQPQNITAGQTSILTLTAPGNQPIGTSALTITAAATVSGLPVVQTGNVSLSVTAPTTSLLGRTEVSDSLETPLAGVTVTMLGKDGNGNSTGCSGSTVSDGAGNFSLVNLPAMCVGPQLIGYDGTTVTSPAGKYAGVNIVYTLVLGQVTASPVLVHLPRIDNVETFQVTQNSSVNQSYAFTSIPGLSVTVYAGTTFTLQDGTKPNPFPLAAVQVPVDRLPDLKPNVPTMIRAFIVAFQPANATTNEPVAVYFPNSLNTAPGTDMVLMTLDPTHGQMVPYGTGSVSADGTQIVPDADPAHAGHLYGLIHFDWHGPMPPPPNQSNPSPPGSGGNSGGNPGGGSGAGSGDGGNNGGDGDGGGDGGDSGGTGEGIPDPDCNSCPCTAKNRLPELFQSERPVLARITTEPAGHLAAATPTLAYSDGDRAEAGDPVDMASGIQTLTHRDLVIKGSRGSLALVRNYRSMTTQAGPFGIGGSHNFNYSLDTVLPASAASINLIMPDGNRFQFAHRVCDLPLINGIVYVCPTGMTNLNVPALAGAVLTPNSDGSADLRWKNGTVYHFVPLTPQFGSVLQSITDANGNVTTIARSGDNITSITDPVGRALTFTYDGSGRVISITDPIGRTTQYAYNAQGSLATFTNPMGVMTRYAYDANNNLVQLTDPRGIVQIQNTLDSSGRVIKQVRSDGGTLTFSYTPANSLATVSPLLASQVSDSTGVVTSYRFNTDGFVTDVTSTQGQTKHIALESGTNIRDGVVMASAATTYTSDPNGNILTSTDPTGLTTSFTYDPTFNKVTSITDSLGKTTSFTYDAKGNLLTTTDANENVTSFEYNSLGLVTKVTDALQQSTTYVYDGSGNRISVTDPLGNTTLFSYDGLSRLTQTIDALGRRTSFAYDGLGRLLTLTDAKGGVTTSAYDADSNLVSIKDAKGNTNNFSYDSMNRLVSRTDGLGKSDTRTWDTDGNLIQYVDRRGQTSTYGYDSLNRLTTETYSDATVTRGYDWYGRLSQVNDSAAGVFTFSRDLAGRLIGNTTPYGAVNYTYDGRGAIASRQVAGQAALSYAYDSAGNLTSASIPQASASFAYSPRNQLTTISRGNGVSSSYSYDADARLLSIVHAKGATTLASDDYGYDATGNRLLHATSTGQPLVTPATSNTFNAANQLTQFGTTANSFDLNGNLAQEGAASTYTWDGRNRLKSITTSAGQTTAFTYDFGVNLLSQADSGTSLNLTKSFILDDITNTAYETASDGTSYSVLAGRGIDSHLAVSESNGETLFGLTDAINSTVAVVDQTGAKQAQFLYEPYGQTTSPGAYPFQFAGRTPATGNLYYNRARFYSVTTGRFVSEDPSGAGGASVNLYQYGVNNPVSAIDPTGLYCIYLVGQHELFCEQPGGTFYTTSAYSGGGLYDSTPECRNNPACQSISGIGPLPTGDYTIGSNQSSEQFPRIGLDPQFDTDRSGFQFHCQGGRGSEGCIATTACQELNTFLNQNPNDTLYVRP